MKNVIRIFSVAFIVLGLFTLAFGETTTGVGQIKKTVFLQDEELLSNSGRRGVSPGLNKSSP
jgi:hypothetical protein